MYPKVALEAANHGQEERSNHAPPAHNHVLRTRNLSALVECLGILQGGWYDRVMFGGNPGLIDVTESHRAFGSTEQDDKGDGNATASSPTPIRRKRSSLKGTE